MIPHTHPRRVIRREYRSGPMPEITAYFVLMATWFEYTLSWHVLKAVTA